MPRSTTNSCMPVQRHALSHTQSSVSVQRHALSHTQCSVSAYLPMDPLLPSLALHGTNERMEHHVRASQDGLGDTTPTSPPPLLLLLLREEVGAAPAAAAVGAAAEVEKEV